MSSMFVGVCTSAIIANISLINSQLLFSVSTYQLVLRTEEMVSETLSVRYI